MKRTLAHPLLEARRRSGEFILNEIRRRTRPVRRNAPRGNARDRSPTPASTPWHEAATPNQRGAALRGTVGQASAPGPARLHVPAPNRPRRLAPRGSPMS